MWVYGIVSVVCWCLVLLPGVLSFDSVGFPKLRGYQALIGSRGSG